MYKKVAFLASVLFIISTTTFAEIPAIAFHKGHLGVTPLANAELLMQMHVEGQPQEIFKLKTNSDAVFELMDRYENYTMRANLIDKNGKVLAGCFSDMVPVKFGQLTLRGVDCL